MNINKRSISILLLLSLILTMLSPISSYASDSYQSLRTPTVADNGVRELGVVFASFTAGQLQQGDSVVFRLPSDFIWTTAAPGSGENSALAAAQTTAEWNTTVVDDTYNHIRYGTTNYVEVPAVYAGNNNGLFRGTEKVLTFTRINDEEVKMEVTGTPTPGQECFFYIYFKRIYVPGGYRGEIPISFDAPSGSGFAAGIAATGKANGSGSKKVEAPAQIKYKLNANFVIGQKKFLLNGAEIIMDVAPYLKDNRTYLPVRYVAHALGVEDSDIKWNEAEQSVTIRKGDVIVKMVIGSKVMFINNTPYTMDVAPEVVEPGRTMLSLRWAAEALGAEVQWDDNKQAVTLKLK